MSKLFTRATGGLDVRVVIGWCVVVGVAVSVQAQVTSNPYPAASNDDTPYSIEMDIFATLPLEPGTFGGTARPGLTKLEPSYDGTGRLFTSSFRGRLYKLESDGSSITTYIDLRAIVGASFIVDMQRGLQSFAFHPDFNKSGEPGYGKFYTAHSTSNISPTADFLPGAAPVGHHEVITEWTATNPLASTFSGTSREILRVAESNIDHNTGTLSFNRNSQPGDLDYGKLYIGFGDGGGAGNPNGLSGTGMTPFGSILRIDPLGNNSANGNYGIPADNPFVGADPKLDEIWLYGLRNSQRYSFDTGGAQNMFIGEIGQGVVEEINIGVKGAHYGWSAREGSFEYVSDGLVGTTDLSNDGLYEYPVAEYDHSDYVDPSPTVSGVSMSGGYVYRDHHFSPLYGKYVFGDLVSGRLMVIDADNLPTGGFTGINELIVTDGGVATDVLTEINQQRAALGLGATARADLRFGVGEHAEIFLVNKQDGTVRVLSPVSLILGDTDGDGDVDADDVTNIKDNFGGTGLGDTNGDRDVDIDDLVNAKNMFGQSAPGLTFVPEPASAALLGLAGLTLMARRRYA